MKILFFDDLIGELKQLYYCFEERYESIKFKYIQTIINSTEVIASEVSFPSEKKIEIDLIEYIKQECESSERIGIVIDLNLTGKSAEQNTDHVDLIFGIFLKKILEQELEKCQAKIDFLLMSRYQVPEKIFQLMENTKFSIKPPIIGETNNADKCVYSVRTSSAIHKECSAIPLIDENYKKSTIYGNFVGDVLFTVLG